MAPLTSKLVAEFTGTFLLVLTVGCNVLSGNAIWGGVSIACVLMVAIYAFGNISGANLNPAVSVSLGLVGKLPWKHVGMYIATQLLAGILAGLTYSFMFHKTFNLAPAEGHTWEAAACCEVFYTFMLCFVVLNVAASNARGKCPNQYYGLAIGFVVIAGAYGAGAVSGGCFNPAVATGIDVSSAYLGFGWCLTYAFFEIVGACLAAGFYRVVRPEEFGFGLDSNEPELVSKLASEFIGTFMLVLTVGLNVLAKSKAGAFSIAASLMCMIYALGDVSGAKFNPAVSLAVLLSGRTPMTPKGAAFEMAAQLAGGVCAAFTYATIYEGQTFALGAKEGFGWVELGMAETIFTFVLCFVVLCGAVAEETATKDMFGLAIGSCVTVGGLAIGGISGGSLNPAVSMGIAAAQTMNGGFFYKALVYSLFEFAGGAAAAALMRRTHAEHYNELKAS